MRGEKRGIFLFPFFGRIGEDELAACWFFIGYSSLLAWPPTRLSASMDLAPLFLAFRFSGGREREGSAPSARIVCQPKWLSLYQSPGIVCHCWRRQRKPWLLGFFRKFADACEVRKQPLPTHAMNKSRLRFCLCVYVCVRVRDRSNYRIPLRIGWSRIRNEIKQRGIYRSRRGINTILMRIRQLGGAILSRLLNLDLKNIRCRQKRGGTLNIARIGPMILTDRNTIPFEFFLRFSKLCHEERRRRGVYLSGMKKERLQDSMVVLDNQLNR